MTDTEIVYATSTIAASIYSLLAFQGCSGDIQLFDDLRRIQHPELEEKQFMEAIVGLIQRGYIRDNNGMFSLVDMKRRPFRNRKLDDRLMREGDLHTDGWEGWMVQDPIMGLVPVEEVIK